MQGQSIPVQVKDPYTGSILMHVGSHPANTPECKMYTSQEQGLYRRGQESLSYVQNSCMSVSYLLTYKTYIQNL